MTEVKEIENNANYYQVLDHGFVGLVDHMGDDSSIVQAARVSYGKGTKTVNEDRGLIRYLMRHKHTTPFEMVEFKFHCKMPIFIARQWIRHRTASVNEYSARYSILMDEFYIPEDYAAQSNSNKQGREEGLSKEENEWVKDKIVNHSKASYRLYSDLLGSDRTKESYPGIARELARMVLPVNAYTEWYWKVNLHNLFHFLKLRMDKHAQQEIQEYANTIYDLISPYVPHALEAFRDYMLYSHSFSQQEMRMINWMIDRDKLEKVSEEFPELLSKREQQEFLAKFK